MKGGLWFAMMCGGTLAACAGSSQNSALKPASTPEASAAPEHSAAPAPSAAVNVDGSKADHFYSETVGFRIVKPKTWVFGTLEAENANRRRMSVGNEQFDERIRRGAAVPLVIIRKYAEPIEKLNPSVKVGIRPAGPLRGKAPRELAEIVVLGMKQSVPSFALDGEISDVVVGGLAAAYFRSWLVVEQVELKTTFRVLSRTWIVPRGDHFFLIGMSGPADGEDVSEADFEQILRSIEIRTAP